MAGVESGEAEQIEEAEVSVQATRKHRPPLGFYAEIGLWIRLELTGRLWAGFGYTHQAQDHFGCTTGMSPPTCSANFSPAGSRNVSPHWRLRAGSERSSAGAAGGTMEEGSDSKGAART